MFSKNQLSLIFFIYQFIYPSSNLQLLFIHYNQDMSVQIVIVLTLVALIYFIYWKPLQAIKRYTEEFSKCGFKVYRIPFNPFAAPFFDMRTKNIKDGDPLRAYKHELVDYDLIVGNVFMKPAIQLLSPEVRKQLIKHESEFCYEKLPNLANHLIRILGRGMLLSEGEEWKGKRKIFSKFFTFQFLNSKIPEITKIIQNCLDELQKQNAAFIRDKNQFDCKIIDLTAKMFSSVILSIFMGFQSLNEKIQDQLACYYLLDLMSDNSIRIQEGLSLLLGPKFLDLGLTKRDADINRRKKLLDAWAENYIDFLIMKLEKDPSKPPTNMIQLLYRQRANHKQNGQGYSKKDLMSELKVFFFAGTDTTAHLVQMMIYHTGKNKQVLRRVFEEIQQQMKSPIESAQDLKKLRYIECIQKQALRYAGPIPTNVLRMVKKDHFFTGVRLQKGAVIQYYSISTHFNEKLYEKPFQFNPERWLGENHNWDPINFVAFGMGPRSCIGQQLAMIQSKIAFAYFFKRFKELEVPEQVEFRWKSMYEAENLKIKIKAKQSSN